MKQDIFVSIMKISCFMETIRICIGCGIEYHSSANMPSHYCCRQCYVHNRNLTIKNSLIKNELSENEIPVQRRNYFKITEAANYLSVTKQFLYQEIRTGKLEAYSHYQSCSILERRQLERWATHKFDELSIDGSKYYSIDRLLAITQKSWSWTFKLLKQYNIPRYKIKGSTRYEKSSFDQAWSIERIKFLDYLSVDEISTITGIEVERCHMILVDGHIHHVKRSGVILYPKSCIKYVNEINRIELS